MPNVFCHLRGDEHECWVDAGLMLSHRLRLWTDIELALAHGVCFLWNVNIYRCMKVVRTQYAGGVWPMSVRCWASSIDGEPVLSKRLVLLDELKAIVLQI